MAAAAAARAPRDGHTLFVSSIANLINAAVKPDLPFDFTTVMQHVRAGELLALAVTDARRSVLLPTLPTVGASSPARPPAGRPRLPPPG